MKLSRFTSNIFSETSVTIGLSHGQKFLYDFLLKVLIVRIPRILNFQMKPRDSAGYYHARQLLPGVIDSLNRADRQQVPGDQYSQVAIGVAWY